MTARTSMRPIRTTTVGSPSAVDEMEFICCRLDHRGGAEVAGAGGIGVYGAAYLRSGDDSVLIVFSSSPKMIFALFLIPFERALSGFSVIASDSVFSPLLEPTGSLTDEAVSNPLFASPARGILI